MENRPSQEIRFFTEGDLKLLINALQQYRRKLQPSNPKAIKALEWIEYFKKTLDDVNNGARYEIG